MSPRLFVPVGPWVSRIFSGVVGTNAGNTVPHVADSSYTIAEGATTLGYTAEQRILIPVSVNTPIS